MRVRFSKKPFSRLLTRHRLLVLRLLLLLLLLLLLRDDAYDDEDENERRKMRMRLTMVTIPTTQRSEGAKRARAAGQGLFGHFKGLSSLDSSTFGTLPSQHAGSERFRDMHRKIKTRMRKLFQSAEHQHGICCRPSKR